MKKILIALILLPGMSFAGSVGYSGGNTVINIGSGITPAALNVTGASTLTGNASMGGTLNVTGATTIGGALHTVGALDTDSTLVVDGASTLTGAVTISNGITGSGAGLTSLTAANISAGSLGGSVIASSITLAAMYGAPTITGTNITAIPAASIDAGSLGGSVIASSVAAGVIVDSNLAGSISPSKITGTAAVLGGNTFSGPLYVASGANVSSMTATGINTPAVVAETSIQGATITGVTYVSGGYVIANSFISLTPKSLATIHTSTPTATDQIHLCSDCINGFLVRSTGTTNCFDWSSANSLTQPE